MSAKGGQYGSFARLTPWRRMEGRGGRGGRVSSFIISGGKGRTEKGWTGKKGQTYFLREEEGKASRVLKTVGGKKGKKRSPPSLGGRKGGEGHLLGLSDGKKRG